MIRNFLLICSFACAQLASALPVTKPGEAIQLLNYLAMNHPFNAQLRQEIAAADGTKAGLAAAVWISFLDRVLDSSKIPSDFAKLSESQKALIIDEVVGKMAFSKASFDGYFQGVLEAIKSKPDQMQALKKGLLPFLGSLPKLKRQAESFEAAHHAEYGGNKRRLGKAITQALGILGTAGTLVVGGIGGYMVGYPGYGCMLALVPASATGVMLYGLQIQVAVQGRLLHKSLFSKLEVLKI